MEPGFSINKFLAVLEKFTDYFQFEMDWQTLTRNTIIPLAYIDQHPEKPWDVTEYNLRLANALYPANALSNANALYPANALCCGSSCSCTCDCACACIRCASACNCTSEAGQMASEAARASEAGQINSEAATNSITPAYIEQELSRIRLMPNSAIIECFFWHNLSSNPNLTLEIIELHYDKPWNYYALASNTFGKQHLW